MRALLVTCSTTVFLLISLSSVAAAQWAILGSEEDLVGKVVIDVGEASRETAQFLEYDPLYEMEVDRSFEYIEYNGGIDICIEEDTMPTGIYSSSKAAILLLDRSETLYIAIIESQIGNIDIEVDRVRRINCPY